MDIPAKKRKAQLLEEQASLGQRIVDEYMEFLTADRNHFKVKAHCHQCSKLAKDR